MRQPLPLMDRTITPLDVHPWFNGKWQELQSWISMGLGLLLLLIGQGCWCLLPAAADSGLLPARGNLGNDILYYVLVDRFFDGDSRNNIPDDAFPLAEQDPQRHAYHQANRQIIEHAFDPTHRYINLYWGGDLAGILQKLDYLQSLGVTKLVLSPIQDHANGLTYNPQGRGYLHTQLRQADEENPAHHFYSRLSTSFHGQWMRDWFEIDEHFRSPEEEGGEIAEAQPGQHLTQFRQLLNEAGSRGMGIILELNFNSTSPFHGGPAYQKFQPSRGENWLVDNGAVFRHGTPMATFWDPVQQTWNPQGWFHPPLAIDFNHPNSKMIEEGNLGQLPDLNQDNAEVRDYLLDAARFWLTCNDGGYPVAGFWLSSVKYVNTRFWQQLEETIHATNPGAVLIGEYANGGYREPASMHWYRDTHYGSLLDYSLSIAARRFFARDRGWDGRTAILRDILLGKGGALPRPHPLKQLLQTVLNPSQSLEIPPQSLDLVSPEDASGWVNFVEVGSEPRLLTLYPQMSERAYQSLLRFLFVSPGVPLLTYGTETGLAVPYHLDHQGLGGIGGDPFNHPMMIWPGDGGWQDRLHRTTQQLIQLRQHHPVLRYGTSRFLFPQGSRRDQDLFLLREFPDCASGTCERVLFAYSTLGGEFLLSLGDRPGQDRPMVQQFEDGETGLTVPAVRGLIPLKLEPEESQVLILR